MNRTTMALFLGLGLLLGGCSRSDPQSAANPPNPPEPEQPPTAPEGLWLAGDMHVHDDHSSDGSLLRQLGDDKGPGNVSIADQIAQAVRMGLEFLPLTDHRTYDQHYDPTWESADLLLIPGEEANGSPHATVHGATDTIVQGAQPEGQPDFVPLQWSIWDAHSQGAVWVTAHPDDGVFKDGQPNARGSAQGVDSIEAWNRASSPDIEIDYGENRWNAGFRFGINGGSDNHFRELWLLAGPGQPITSVFAADRSERALLQGLWGGRTRITESALSPELTLEADLQDDGVFEAISGDEVIAPAGRKGTLRIGIRNALGTQVMLYRSPGRSAGPLQTFRPGLFDEQHLVEIEVGAEPSWYRLEARGAGIPAGINLTEILPGGLIPFLAEIPNALRATTSPIFISTAPVEAEPEIPLPADSGSDDGALLALGAQGQFGGFPDLAISEGTTHLVAELHERAATRVVYRSRSGNRWSEPVSLALDSNSARFPRVAARGRDVWVAWQDEMAGQRPRRPAIRLRHSSDGGATWQPTQTLRAIEGRAERPDLALDAQGRPLVAWQEIRAQQPFDIWAQLVGLDEEPRNLTREGKTVRAALLVDSRSARYPASVRPRVAARGDGLLAVSWQDNRTDPDPLWTGETGRGEGTDPDNWQIQVATRPVGGDWTASLSVGADDRADRHPAIAFDGQGRIVLAWDSKELRSSGVNTEVLSAISDEELKTFGEPSPIAAGPAMSQYPELGAAADGSVRAAWYDSRSADWRWRVMTARLVSGTWQEAKLVNSRGVNTWPATDGGAIVFASTRNAQRMQRDRTQQVYLLVGP
ncbi:CehA/McbA family metallohydrolase [Solimonas sp. SE-A11]|uniref:CehA/McbA family metallohydrolase n=1 Tax=Solimonas sp. SE-A11 TaxID=3054954 RepID=UPI00259CDDB8|nr:CehA/McbA family metallohydrolase [Solimonas sp. SE-A11]MDM4771192.1 CehA/McbA family metallohydrolase [Solimonas sp. SE-A11]